MRGIQIRTGGFKKDHDTLGGPSSRSAYLERAMLPMASFRARGLPLAVVSAGRRDRASARMPALPGSLGKVGERRPEGAALNKVWKF